MTEDADLALAAGAAASGANLAAALAAAGFREELGGRTEVPSGAYHLDDAYVEFIAPLVGGGGRRPETAQTAVVAGLIVARLRFADLLLVEPWSVRLSPGCGFPVQGGELDVHVVNPASYLMQKTLTLPRRGRSYKRGKDALYLHDTLSLFGTAAPALRPQAQRVLTGLPAKTAARFHRLRRELFSDPTVIGTAADIALGTGRPEPPSPERIAEVCVSGLEALFGD